VGSSLWASLAAFHSKGGTAAKSSRLEEVIQGCPLNTCSAFSVPGLVKIPNAFAFFSFFLDQLCLLSLLIKELMSIKPTGKNPASVSCDIYKVKKVGGYKAVVVGRKKEKTLQAGWDLC